MKALIVLCVTVCLIGCTTLHPVANVPGDLSQQFNDGGALHPGDRVVIRTVGGARHELRVMSVRDGVVYGEHDSVPFADIASIDRRETSAVKTAVLVGVILGVVGVIAAAANAGLHPRVGI
jgi:hypothetical protein